MNSFETTAILDDDRHLTLHEPMPKTSARECRVIVLFEEEKVENRPKVYTKEFFESIYIDDPTFVRPDQGEWRPIDPLDK